MYLKFKIIILALVILSSSFNLFAKTPNQKNNPFVFTENEFKHIESMKWHTIIDIYSLKKNNLINFVDNYHLYVSESINLELNKIPNEIESIHLYGNKFINQGDIYTHLYGNFKDSSVEDIVFHQLLKNDDTPPLEKLRSYKYKNSIVYIYKVSGDKDKNRIYATKLNDDFILVSNKRISTMIKKVSIKHRYLSKNYLEHKNAPKGILAHIYIDTKALRKKLQKDSYLMQSTVLLNTRNIVFKVVKKESNIYLASALSTKNNETAIQVNKVINRIIENYIQSNNTLENIKSKLINNLRTEVDDKRVTLITHLPLNQKGQ